MFKVYSTKKLRNLPESSMIEFVTLKTIFLSRCITDWVITNIYHPYCQISASHALDCFIGSFKKKKIGDSLEPNCLGRFKTNHLVSQSTLPSNEIHILTQKVLHMHSILFRLLWASWLYSIKSHIKIDKKNRRLYIYIYICLLVVFL